jgi:hypothetical protein
MGDYLAPKLLLWTEEDARGIMGDPLAHRYGNDDSRNLISDIYTFSDPTVTLSHIELAFDIKTKRLTNIYLYPSFKTTWDDFKKLWGDKVTIKDNPDGTRFRFYNDRRLNVYFDKDDNVISVGLYPAR